MFIYVTCKSYLDVCYLRIAFPLDESGHDNEEADRSISSEEETSTNTQQAKSTVKENATKSNMTKTKKPTNNRKPKAKKDTDAAEDGLQDDSEPQQQQKKKSVIDEEEYQSEDEGVSEPIQIQEFELPVNIKPRRREDKWSKNKVMDMLRNEMIFRCNCIWFSTARAWVFQFPIYMY